MTSKQEKNRFKNLPGWRDMYSCAQNKPTFSLIMKQIKGQSSTKKQV